MLFYLLIASVSVALAAEAEVKVEVQEEPNPSESVHHMNNDDYSFADGLELMRHRERQLHSERHHILGGHVHRYDEDPHHPANDRLDKHDLPGPVILRTPDPLPHHGHPDIEAQNRIIADVFSPDYYQPTWVLDYRYLKTGGRDYTRGPGGQILILPRGVRTKEHKEFTDYDAYLEHLRLSRLAERQHHRHEHEDDRHHEWQNAHAHRQNQHGHEHSHGHNRVPEHAHGHDRAHDYGHGHDRMHNRGHERDRVHDRGHGHGQNMWQRY